MKRRDEVDAFLISKIMREFGFRPDGSTATARAFFMNLVRSAYGPEAAREFMRQMNLEQNRGIEVSTLVDEFNAFPVKPTVAIDGVGTEEEQLSFFDSAQTATGPFGQKKSRRAK